MSSSVSIAGNAGLDGRSRILAAARDLFLANGFTAVSMQQIADAAGVNKATLYHHFTDKEALFVEIMRQAFDSARAVIADAAAGSGGLGARLERVATQVFASPPTDIGRLISDLREHVSVESRNHLMAQVTPPWSAVAEVFRAALAAGEIRAIDPDFVGRMYFSAIVSQLGWAKFGGAPPNAATAALLVDVMLHGVMPEASAGHVAAPANEIDT